MKKITKVIVYFDDGTFEEMKSQPSVVPHYTWPQYKPYVTPQVDPWSPPYVVTSGNTPLTLSNSNDNSVADGAPITNKYTITSSGNGNVEVQR
jgi:hypothetical protein